MGIDGAAVREREQPRPGAALVLVRSVVLGFTLLATGTLAHVSAGGALPPPAAMAGLLAWLVAVVAPFTVRRLGAPALVLVTVGGQALSHLLLSAVAGHAGDPAGSGGTLLTHQWQHLVAQGPLMVGTHLLGSVVVGLLLAGEERNLWVLVDLLVELSSPTRLVAAVAGPAAARLQVLLGLAGHARRVARSHPPSGPPRTTLALTSQIVRRGPPQLLAR